MQLSKPQSIRRSLSLATCTLLHAHGQAALAQETPDQDTWDIDSAVMIYAESDERVSLIESVVKASTEIKDDEYFSVQIVLDALTGATPNGATASSQVQTFTSPSGEKTYTVDPGDLPLDSTFRDTRAAVNASWDRPINRLTRIIWGLNASKEYDYLSLGASATLTRDFNERNTTLTAGLGFNADTIDPVGGKPMGLSTMAQQQKEGSDDKTVTDLLLGITQVIDRATLMQFNYSYGDSSGYLNDPYKIVSEIDHVTGLPTGTYYFEQRPDNRVRQALYWKTVHHLTEDVINVSYRYYWDDWDISSHTLDLKYRYELGDGAYLQPRLRYYTQTAADFYRHSLPDNEALPEHVSADYRLGEFTGTTLGLKYGRPVGQDSEFSMRIEYIQQNGDSNPGDAIGDQKNQDLYPSLDAIVLQASYSLRW